MRYECRRDRQLCLPARSGSSSPLPQRMTQPGSGLQPPPSDCRTWAGGGGGTGRQAKGGSSATVVGPSPTPTPGVSGGKSGRTETGQRTNQLEQAPRTNAHASRTHTLPSPSPQPGKVFEACFLLPPPLPCPLPHAPQGSPHPELEGPQPRGGV